MTRILKRVALVAATALVAGPAFAHTGVGHADGFVAGLTHPVLGPDHLLAMLSVGIWSALAGGRRALAAPAAFVLAMVAGAGLAFAGLGLPSVEGMVAASVLALGLMVVAGAQLPFAAGVALSALFALFHGHAHASEATGNVASYIAGFGLTTVLIHVAGLGIGTRLATSRFARIALGGMVTAAGAYMLAGL